MRHAEPPSDWIFLRGLVRESAHWGDFPERFSARIPNSRVLPIDLPGNGTHWRLPSPTSITATMEFARREAVEAWAPTARPPAPRYLFAISLGGMVALEWLHRHPSEIAGAVLVNTSLSRLSPFYRRLSWRAWPAVLKIALQRNTRARERAILELTSRYGAEPRQVESRVEAYRRHPIRRLNLIRQLRAAAAYRSPPESPAAPVLLLNSRGDRLVDPACSEAIARHWHVRLATHPWAGHDLPLDDPEWILAEVADWLGSMGYRPESGNRFVT
jgi:pimeloyl-ACP methyl ester carboxylesterase